MTIDERALRAAFAANHPDSEPSETELAELRRSILAYEAAKRKKEGRGSERFAKLIEGMMKQRRYSRWPQSRGALAVAAIVVRRGRLLTDDETMQVLVNMTKPHDSGAEG